MANFANSGLVNVTWADALRHTPPGIEKDGQRRYGDIDATCNATVVVCAGQDDTHCTGASTVRTAPADAGFLIMPHPRLSISDNGDDAKEENSNEWTVEDMEEMDKNEPLKRYKWGLAISCPHTQSTGIQWRRDKCVYKMGEGIDYNTAYNVKGNNLTKQTQDYAKTNSSLRTLGH